MMLRQLLEEERLQPDEALMIGDTDYDIEMAAAIGMPSVGVICGVHSPQRLRRAGALALLESVRELPSWLRPLRAG